MAQDVLRLWVGLCDEMAVRLNPTLFFVEDKEAKYVRFKLIL